MIMALGTHPPNGGNLGRDVDPPQPLRDFRLPIMANRSALPTLPGANLTLSKLRGRPVLLSFWASWCPPCRRDAPRIEAAWQAWRGRGVIVIGIDTNDASNAALAFTHQAGLTFPILRDGGNRTAGRYGLLGLPEAFLLDQDGRARVHWIGELSETDLGQQIARLANPPPDTARVDRESTAQPHGRQPRQPG
ncbi:MAG: TlpA disulfide reductase family protein [Thermoleophilia bacterium]